MSKANKRQYGHGKDRRDSRMVMRITKTEDERLEDLTRYLGKSRSDVVRDALTMYYHAEGGDDIRNRPPKNSNVHFNLSESDIKTLAKLGKESGESDSVTLHKAITLFKMFKEME